MLAKTMIEYFCYDLFLYFLLANNSNLRPNVCYISQVCSSRFLQLFSFFLLYFFMSSIYSALGREGDPFESKINERQSRILEGRRRMILRYLFFRLCCCIVFVYPYLISHLQLIGFWGFSIYICWIPGSIPSYSPL